MVAPMQHLTRVQTAGKVAGRRAVAVTFALLLAGLAGCTKDSGGTDAIGVSNGGAAGGAGPYTFTAKVTSENGNYTWDMGDQLTVLHGESVTHTYDFKDSAGNVTVTLRVRQGGADKAYTTGLRLGSGQNAQPAFALDAQTNWAVTGETVKFSAARSSDPDHDPLRYSWNCIREGGDLVKKPVHSHGPPVSPYATPPAGSVTGYLANYTLPAATTTYPGDLCGALQGGTAPSLTASTIAGAFAQTGKYKVFLKASDGAHPTVSGNFEIYVSTPGDRPAEWQRHTFSHDLELGGAGQLQKTCEMIPPGQVPTSCDVYEANFDLVLGGLYGWVNVTYTKGASGQNNLTWELYRNDKLVINGGPATPDSKYLTGAALANGPYRLIATFKAGVQTNVTMDVNVRLNLDPLTVY